MPSPAASVPVFAAAAVAEIAGCVGRPDILDIGGAARALSGTAVILFAPRG